MDGSSRRVAYSASKAAVGMLVRELAVDLAPFGIRVNAVAPGAVDNSGRESDERAILLYRTPMNPVYIARAIAFLASDHHSAFTTGATLTVDAGLSLFNHRVDRFPPEGPE